MNTFSKEGAKEILFHNLRGTLAQMIDLDSSFEEKFHNHLNQEIMVAYVNQNAYRDLEFFNTTTFFRLLTEEDWDWKSTWNYLQDGELGFSEESHFSDRVRTSPIPNYYEGKILQILSSTLYKMIL